MVASQNGCLSRCIFFGYNFGSTIPTGSVRFFVLSHRLNRLIPQVLHFVQFAQFLLYGREPSINNGKDVANRALISTF